MPLAKVARVLAVATAVLALHITFVRSSSPACTNDEDCLLNGACSSGACTCDKGWTGPDCGELNLAKVRLPTTRTVHHTT